jgi:hypothetical protein
MTPTAYASLLSLAPWVGTLIPREQNALQVNRQNSLQCNRQMHGITTICFYTTTIIHFTQLFILN